MLLYFLKQMAFSLQNKITRREICAISDNFRLDRLWERINKLQKQKEHTKRWHFQ